MAEGTTGAALGVVEGSESLATERPSAERATTIARRGIRTTRDFVDVMNGVIAGVLDGTLNPDAARAVVSAGGQMLKAAELAIRYGTPTAPGLEGERNLTLVA